MADKKFDEIYQRLSRIGAAIEKTGGNSLLSGNLSLCDPDDADIFYITASGSQCGALNPTDIVQLRFSRRSRNDNRASTETPTHRKVLNITGVNAVVHAHCFNSTLISFDTGEQQLFLQHLGKDRKGRDEFLFLPIDLYGSFCIGEVPVNSYFEPVGSAEMEERIPQYLTENQSTIVQAHGPFIRANSPEKALHLLTILDISAEMAVCLRRRSIDVIKIQRLLQDKSWKSFFPVQPHQFQDIDFTCCDIKEKSVIQDFKQRLIYNFNHRLSGFATGSMSLKVSDTEMIYCPLSALPENFSIPLLKKSIKPGSEDSLDLKIHKLIYQNTDQNSCMITVSPRAVAEGMVVLAEKYGIEVLSGDVSSISYTNREHPVITAVDAEAGYCSPELGVVDITQITNLTSDNPIPDMLRKYKGCCVVANYGVVSTSRNGLEQTACKAFLAERIAGFRQEAWINQNIQDVAAVNDFHHKNRSANKKIKQNGRE